MSAMWVIYLADVVHGLSALFFFLGFGWLFVSTGILINSTDDRTRYTDEEEAKKKEHNEKVAVRFLKQITVCLALILLSVAIPSKDTVYMMAAAKLGQNIVEAPETKEISGRVLQLINEKLDEQLGHKEKK